MKLVAREVKTYAVDLPCGATGEFVTGFDPVEDKAPTKRIFCPGCSKTHHPMIRKPSVYHEVEVEIP